MNDKTVAEELIEDYIAQELGKKGITPIVGWIQEIKEEILGQWDEIKITGDVVGAVEKIIERRKEEFNNDTTLKLYKTAEESLKAYFKDKDDHPFKVIYTTVEGTNERVKGYKGSPFSLDVTIMNQIMELPTPECMLLPTTKDLREFKGNLSDELNEIDEIIDMLSDPPQEKTKEWMLEILVKVADLLGDIQVYTCSQATKYGIPLDYVLMMIMNSNFTKLGEDGKRVWNEEKGKFEKGPNYIPPEPALKNAFSKSFEIKE